MQTESAKPQIAHTAAQPLSYFSINNCLEDVVKVAYGIRDSDFNYLKRTKLDDDSWY